MRYLTGLVVYDTAAVRRGNSPSSTGSLECSTTPLPPLLFSGLNTKELVCLFKQRSSERGKERSFLFCSLTLCWSRLSLILRPSKSLQKALIIDLKEFTKGLSFFALQDKFKFDVVVNIGEPGLDLQRCHFQTYLNLFVSLLSIALSSTACWESTHCVIRADGMY